MKRGVIVAILSICSFLGSAGIAAAAVASTTIGTNISTNGTLTVGGDAAFDTDTLFVDSANHRIGIGDATPAALFTVGASSALQIDGSGNVTTGGNITGNSIIGDGSSLTSLTPANISAGTAGIDITGNAGTVTNGVYTTDSGTVFLAPNGDGSGLTGLTASQVGLGNVVNADTTTTANITDSLDKRFVSDAQLTVIGNTSGTNTGDQDLSGFLVKSSNLSDLTSASTARTNLGLVIGTNVLAPNGNGSGLTSLNASNISQGSGSVNLVSFDGTLMHLDSGTNGALTIGTGGSAKTVTIGSTVHTLVLDGATVNVAAVGTDASASAVNIANTSNATGTQTVNIGSGAKAANAVNIAAGSTGNVNVSGTLALGSNNLTMTGSLGATGARLTKGWYTDLEVTNAIVGGVTGNAGTATALAANGANCIAGSAAAGVDASGAAEGCAPFLTTALPDNVASALTIDENGNSYLNFNTTNGTESLDFGNATTNQAFHFNGSGTATFGGDVTATGALSGSNFSGSSSGTNTGDQTSVTGNAGTATALQTARTINGVSFNGTSNITIPRGLDAYAMFYGLTAGTGNGGTDDYASTVAVGNAVPFPRDGASLGGIVSTTDTTFTIPDAGTYDVTFHVQTTEPGQLQLRVNGAVVNECIAANMNPTSGAHPIDGNCLITVGAGAVLEVINPVGNSSALTVTPADGNNTHANSQTLVIKKL